MQKRRSLKPTDGELEILRVLWNRGPSSVGEVHKILGTGKGTSYNTTLKLMQIMFEKGLLTRNESQRPQLYIPKIAEGDMQGRLVRDLLQKAFGGSARKLVAALNAGGLSETEKEEIRKLLEEKPAKTEE